MIRKFNNFLFFNRLSSKVINLNSNNAHEILEFNKHRVFGSKPNLCYAPHLSLYFNAKGDVLVCCKNDKISLGNINSIDLIDIWNSKKRKELIESLSDFDLKNGCEFCEKMLHAKNYASLHANVYDPIFHQKDANYPTDITFEISNTCNFECVMCEGNHSSLIRKNVEKLPDIPFVYTQKFFEQLKPFLKHVKVIRLQGGEPFLINNYLDIIDYLILHNKRCRIYIQTNGSVYNNRVKNILQYPNIYLSISIDAFNKALFENIRRKSNFDRIMSNVTLYKKSLQKNKSKININFCLMNMNWHELPNLFNFCFSNNFTLSIIPIEYPPIYKVSALTPNEVNNIISYINTQISLEIKKEYDMTFKSLCNFLEFAKEESVKNEQFLSSYIQKTIQELLLSIENNLVGFLQENSIKDFSDFIQNKIIPFNEDRTKTILSRTIINNRVILDSDVEMEFYDIRFLNKLKEFFNYELNQLQQVCD